VGECRSGEALDMLQAMNTGHDGSLTTLHANGPREAISRLETMCLMAGMDMPLEVIRAQIATAVNLIVQQSRLKDGSRKITQITEIQGMEGSSVTMQDLFVYKTPDHQGPGPSHAGGGTLEPSGFRPRFYHLFDENGIKIDSRVFGADRMQFTRK
jgi:pilus assembly protein CpaF